MTQLLLVCGFLGAGKTTLMKRLIAHFSAQRLFVIVNEFGAAGVDGTLLQNLGAAVREIDNGSIFCACRVAEFEQALTQAQDEGAQMILVESSGFSDPVAIRRILNAYPGIDYLGSIALADAQNLHRVIDTSRIAARQLGISRLILLNKTDLATAQQLACAQSLLQARCPLAHIYPTRQAQFDPAWLQALQAGEDWPDSPHAPDITLQKVSLHVSAQALKSQLEDFFRRLAEDTNRIKGIVLLKEGAFYADGVGAMVTLSAWDGPLPKSAGRLTILAGPGLPLRQSLRQALGPYAQWITEVKA